MVIIGLKFFFTNLIMLLFAAILDRSKLIKRIIDLPIKIGRRLGFHLLLTFIFILSPLYLFPVLLYLIPSIGRRFNKERTGIAMLIAAVLLGSLLLPIGNQRILFISIFLKTMHQNFSPLISLTPAIFPYWILFLFILNILAYIFKIEIQDSIVQFEKVRYQELVLSIIALFFIIPFAMGKLNFLGFVFLTGFLFFAFISKETIKRVRWIFLIYPLLSVPLSMMPLKTPIVLSRFPLLFIPFITSGFITSDFSTIIFSNINVDLIVLVMGVAAGSLIGYWGSFELIYVKFIRKKGFNPIFLSLFGIFVVLIGMLTFLTGRR